MDRNDRELQQRARRIRGGRGRGRIRGQRWEAGVSWIDRRLAARPVFGSMSQEMVDPSSPSTAIRFLFRALLSVLDLLALNWDRG